MLEIPFPQQACLVLDTQGPAEAHIKGAAAVLIILPPSVFLYVLLSFCVFTSSPSLSVSIYIHVSFTTEEQLSLLFKKKDCISRKFGETCLKATWVFLHQQARQVPDLVLPGILHLQHKLHLC